MNELTQHKLPQPLDWTRLIKDSPHEDSCIHTDNEHLL